MMRLFSGVSVSTAAFVAMLSLIIVTGCTGSASVGDHAANSETVSNSVVETADSDGSETAPDFTLQTLDGEQIQLSDSSGEIRLVDFWATWCAPCREEIPMLNELQASYGDRGFRILAISDEEVDVIRNFVDRHGVEYTNLVGTEDVAEAYGVLGLPSAYLIDGEGRVIESFLGPKTRRVLTKKIEALLSDVPAT